MFGVILFLVAAVFGIVGLMQHMKGKRILAAPFKKTGELAKNPQTSDPKGAISTEGAIIPPAQQLLSPCTKTPCLYYEVEIRRHWEKQEQTQDGLKTRTGSDSHTTLKDGATIGLDDGTGAFKVDFKQGADFDKMERKYEEKVKLGMFVPGELQFGQLRMQTPVHIGSDRTVAYEAIEKIVPMDGNLFVLGKLEGDKIVKPGWRSMLASKKGRDGLLASTATKKKVGFIGGGAAAVLAIPAFIFSPKPSADANAWSCPSIIVGVQNRCHDNVNGSDDFELTVEKETRYHVDIFPAKGKAYGFIPRVTVKDSAGKEVERGVGGVATDMTLNFDAKPGKYTIVVEPDDGAVSGGYDYELAVRGDGVEAPKPAGEAVAAGDKAAGDIAADSTPIEMDAPVFAAKYLANKDDADAQYTGKTVKLKGMVAEAGADSVSFNTSLAWGIKGALEAGQDGSGLSKDKIATMTCKVAPLSSETTIDLLDCKVEASAAPGKPVAAAAGTVQPAAAKTPAKKAAKKKK
jgi:hypothetical protein